MPRWGEILWGSGTRWGGEQAAGAGDEVPLYGVNLSDVRLDDHAHACYVLFIDGHADAYTDDDSGGLWGTGTGTWIGNSETAIGGIEQLGQRRVRPGLKVPESVSFRGDPKSGLQPSPASFVLMDLEGDLVELFASEGQDYEILGQRIKAGTNDLTTDVQTFGGGTTPPEGKYIGIEKIRSDGARRQYPAIPFTLCGFEHAVHGAAAPPGGLPPVRISTMPLEWAGRLVTLYRIYKSPGGDASNPASWYTWDQQHAQGNLVWWGVLRDAGDIAGNREWSLDCHGPDAMLRKTLGTRVPNRWMKVFAPVAVEDEQKYVAISFGAMSWNADPDLSILRFNSSVFDHAFTTEDNKAEIVQVLNPWIADALDGSDVNLTPGDGVAADWTMDADPQNPDAEVTSDGFRVRKDEEPDAPVQMLFYMAIAMHETYWRMLGFEPETQDLQNFINSGTLDEAKVEFTKLEAGEQYSGRFATGVDVPADGYWRAVFYTMKPGYTFVQAEAAEWDNDGQYRTYRPFHVGPGGGEAEVFVLNKNGQQQIQLASETSEQLYLEAQKTVGVSALATIDGTATEHSRWFVLRGEIVQIEDDLGTEGVELTEARKIYQVFRGSWVEGNHYGEVAATDNVSPGIYIEAYDDPMVWGFNCKKLDHAWAGKIDGRGKIECAALSTYHYKQTEKPYELAHTILTQILLSTGSSAGWVGEKFEPGQPPPACIPGVNQPDDLDDAFGGDVEIADMGLAIPKELVAPMASFRAAFRFGDSWDEHADFNRQRLAFVGPYQSLDVLDALMKPRAVYWSLHGKQFGVYRLGPVSLEDVDVVITEDDLHGTPGQPTSVIPQQNLRATGQIDVVHLDYRPSPDGGQPQGKLEERARDPGAHARTGELEEKLVDKGLPATEWWGSAVGQEAATGVGEWKDQFRDLWAHDMAEFMAKRHFSCTLEVGRHIGQDIMPGTSVAITNPWLVNPAGSYGVTSRTGRAIGVTQHLKSGHATVECIVFAGDQPRHYAPILAIDAVTDDEMRYREAFFSSKDGQGWTEPTWSSQGGAAQWDMYVRNNDTWTLWTSGSISSVDTTTRIITAAATVSPTPPRDKDKILVLRSRQNQTANTWPAEVYGVHCTPDGKYDGTNKGEPFVEAL